MSSAKLEFRMAVIKLSNGEIAYCEDADYPLGVWLC